MDILYRILRSKDLELTYGHGKSCNLAYIQFLEISQEEVPLLEPDVLICSVGTEIFFESNSNTAPIPDSKWIEVLNKGWDRDAVCQIAAKFSEFSLQVRHFVISFKIGILDIKIALWKLNCMILKRLK